MKAARRVARQKLKEVNPGGEGRSPLDVLCDALDLTKLHRLPFKIA